MKDPPTEKNFQLIKTSKINFNNQFKIYNYDIKTELKVISKTGIFPIRNSFGHGWTATGIKKKQLIQVQCSIPVHNPQYIK